MPKGERVFGINETLSPSQGTHGLIPQRKKEQDKKRIKSFPYVPSVQG